MIFILVFVYFSKACFTQALKLISRASPQTFYHIQLVELFWLPSFHPMVNIILYSMFGRTPFTIVVDESLLFFMELATAKVFKVSKFFEVFEVFLLIVVLEIWLGEVEEAARAGGRQLPSVHQLPSVPQYGVEHSLQAECI